MNISSRDRRAMVVGGVALAAILVVKFAVMPWAYQWLDTRDDIRQVRDTLASYETRFKRLEVLNKRLVLTYGKAVGEPLEDIELTRVRFHKVVQDVLKAAGFKMESLQPQAARSIRKRVPGVAVFPIRVVGKCQIQQLAKCLAQVRAAPCLIIVDRVNVTSDPKNPSQLSVTMVLAALAEEGAER